LESAKALLASISGFFPIGAAWAAAAVFVAEVALAAF